MQMGCVPNYHNCVAVFMEPCAKLLHPAKHRSHKDAYGQTQGEGLKFCLTLQSIWSCSHWHLCSIMVGSIVNVLPFVSSWRGILLSFASWIQMDLLCRFPKSSVARAFHVAVPRMLSRIAWDITLPRMFHRVGYPPVLTYCRSILRALPMT